MKTHCFGIQFGNQAIILSQVYTLLSNLKTEVGCKVEALCVPMLPIFFIEIIHLRYDLYRNISQSLYGLPFRSLSLCQQRTETILAD